MGQTLVAAGEDQRVGGRDPGERLAVRKRAAKVHAIVHLELARERAPGVEFGSVADDIEVSAVGPSDGADDLLEVLVHDQSPDEDETKTSVVVSAPLGSGRGADAVRDHPHIISMSP